MTDPTILKIERFLRSPLLLIAVGVGGVVVPVLLLVASVWAFGHWYRPLLDTQFAMSMVTMAVMLLVIIHACAACILFERKIASYTQDRHGPNRVGYWGWLQPVADGIKMLIKENIIPSNVDKPLFLLAPGLAFALALLGFAIIPWGGAVHFPWMPEGQTVRVQVADLNVGFLYLLAVGSIAVYGVVLAGYASNNKYAFYGGMRATAQMLSYELPMGLALMVMLLVAGTLKLDEMVMQQASSGLWYIFLQPVAFFLLTTAAFAETNRAPFDLAEAEQELVGGYHTEYSAMKFGMFFLGEYAHMITNSGLIVAIFLGGWAPLPFVGLLAGSTAWWAMLIKVAVFLGKIGLMIGLYMVIRWTIPRFRFDQLMRLAWKSMIPVGIVLLVGVTLLTAMGLQRSLFWNLLLNVVVVGILLFYSARGRVRVTGRQESLPEVEIRPA